MDNPINAVFSDRKNIKLMTHVVAGYPDLKTSKELIVIMAQSGVDMIEIQIPFSDPLADGPTIMMANQKALDNGTTPADCFKMAKELKDTIPIPLLFMTYVNIPFRMGMENFIKQSAESGIHGLIIPDIPFDEKNTDYINTAAKYGIYPIQLVSPDTTVKRLKQIVHHVRGFIYTTLKVGITGARKQIDKKGVEFINTIKTCTTAPIAAGFGISSPEHVKQLQGVADVAIIGSHIINLFNQHGLEKVAGFIKTCKMG